MFHKLILTRTYANAKKLVIYPSLYPRCIRLSRALGCIFIVSSVADANRRARYHFRLNVYLYKTKVNHNIKKSLSRI